MITEVESEMVEIALEKLKQYVQKLVEFKAKIQLDTNKLGEISSFLRARRLPKGGIVV